MLAYSDHASGVQQRSHTHSGFGDITHWAQNSPQPRSKKTCGGLIKGEYDVRVVLQN